MNGYTEPIVKILDFSILSAIPFNDDEGGGGANFSQVEGGTGTPPGRG